MKAAATFVDCLCEGDESKIARDRWHQLQPQRWSQKSYRQSLAARLKLVFLHSANRWLESVPSHRRPRHARVQGVDCPSPLDSIPARRFGYQTSCWEL